MNEFKIRTYGFSELALLYVPNVTKKSASCFLNRKIKADAELEQKLKAASYRPKLKILTPKMVNVFVEFLGEPY